MHPHQIWRPIGAMIVLVAATMLATTTVVIEPGDTLSAIARRHDVTVAELVAWNDLEDPDRIVAGATLIVSAPDASSPSAVGDGAGVHVVTAGDTLSAIARRFGVSIARLVEANDLDDPDRIVEGQTIRVNAPVATTTTTTPARTYTVVAGDTLWTIASRLGVTIADLAAANDIADIDRIREGVELTIDGDAPAPSTPTTTTTVPPTTVPPTTVPPTTVPTTTVPAGTADRDADEVLLVPMFAHWADTYDVPQDLLEAIAWKESSWQPDAVGPTGNLGVMQLSPATVELIEGGLLGRDLDPLDADEAIQMGARFLRYLLDRTHTEDEAVAAWAQGLASVQEEGIGTRGATYVAAVTEIRQQRA
ncbi:MAG: LysM peptidoglycan-binding domain-containing protein [Acidimicrobiales bacterium]|nr:LysM peptidoglycan-binding domain-containing protein [Acidimicrobiales bacterium]